MIKTFSPGKGLVFCMLLLSACVVLTLCSLQVFRVAHSSPPVLAFSSFSSKAELKQSEPSFLTTDVTQQEDPDPEALALADQAMDLRFDRMTIALHMMSQALRIDDHPLIREKAQEILQLTEFIFEEEWIYAAKSVNSIAVSPDGELIVIGDDYGVITLLSSEGEELGSFSSAHDNSIDALAFSPDGMFLAAGSHDNYFSIWKVEGASIELDARHYYGDDWVRSLVFAPDGSEVYVAGDMYYSLVYNMASRSVTDTLGGHQYYVYGIAVSDDGEVLASGDGEGLLKVWSKTETGWEEAGDLTFGYRINDIAFNTDRLFYIAMSEGQLAQLEVSAPFELSETYLIQDSGQEYAAVAIVGNAVIAGGDGNRMDVIAGADIGTALLGGYVSDVVNYDGRSVLIGVDYILKRGRTRRIETMSVAELMDGQSLQPLSISEKVEFNLWDQEEIDALSAPDQIALFNKIDEILEGNSWEHTDRQRLSTLIFDQAEQTIDPYFRNPKDPELASVLAAIVPVLGKDQRIFERALGADQTPATAILWLSLLSREEISANLRKYAAKRAYALSPSEEWGQLLESSLANEELAIEVPDVELTYGCDANSVTFSPDGKYVYVTTDRGEDCEGGYLYPIEDGIVTESRSITYPHQSNIMWQGAFSVDGQRIASASTDGTVIIYNLNGGTEHIFATDGGEVGFSDARILRDGTVITADNNGMILQWTLGKIVPDRVIAEQSAEARKLAIIREETIALSVGYSGVLYVHDLVSGETETITIDPAGIDDIAINADETMALLGLVGGGGVLVDLQTMRIARRIPDAEPNDYQCAAFAGDLLLFGTDEGMVKAYNQAGTLLFSKRIHEGTVYDISISADGKYIATGGGDDRVTIWAVEQFAGAQMSWITDAWKEQVISESDWSHLLTIAGRSGQETLAAAFFQQLLSETPKGPAKEALKAEIKKSLFFSLDGKNVAPKGGLKVYSGFPEGLNGIHFSTALGYPVALGEAGTIFGLSEQEGYDVLGHIPNSEPRCFAELSNGGWAVAEPGYVYILDNNFELESQLEPHSGTIYDIALSKDGSYLATASADYEVALIETETFTEKAAIRHENECNAVAFFEDGSGFVTGADDQTVKFWDMQGNLKRSANIGTNVWALDVSADGDRIAAGTNEGEIVLLDATGTEYARWEVDDQACWAITFSPDGQSFATGNNDGDISVWGRDGELIFRFDTGESMIFEMTYSSDGAYLFVATTDGEVYRFLME